MAHSHNDTPRRWSSSKKVARRLTRVRRHRSAARRLTRTGLERPVTNPVEDRFLSFVERDHERPDSHWRWRGYRNRWGQAVFRLWNGPALAARVAFVMFAVDCLKKGERLHRTCSEADCVAPAHYEIKRAGIKRAGNRLKVTPEIARAIRADIAGGKTMTAVAALNDLSISHVCRVARGEYPRSAAA